MVSLAIVGTVAALTVPTLINNVQQSKRATVFRQAISQLAQVIYAGVNHGELCLGMDRAAYIKSKLNVVSTLGDGSYLLPNGAQVVSITERADSTLQINLDWNGVAPPNVHYAPATGSNTDLTVVNYIDREVLWANADSTPRSGSAAGNISPVFRAGELRPYSYGPTLKTVYVALYEQLFSGS